MSSTIETVNLDFNTFDVAPFVNPIVNAVNKVVPQLPSLIVGILLAVLLIRVAVRLARFLLTLTAMSLPLRNVLANALHLALWIAFVIQVLQLMGLGGVVIFFTTSVAAIGLVMAAGGSTLISDILAGVFLASNHNLAVGDEVIISGMFGADTQRGIIEGMDSRRTYLRDKRGRLHVLPNSLVERRDWIIVKRGQSETPLARVKGAATKLRRTAIRQKLRLDHYIPHGRSKREAGFGED